MLVSTAKKVSPVAPVPLPHLLCRSPKGGHLPDQTYEVTKEAPSQVQKKELAQAAELEEFPYPKGKPVSYGPPKMEIEPTAQPAAQASAAEPQQNEDVIEIPQTQQTHPEVIEDPQTEAEALANLQALMGELQRLGGSKPPAKPQEDPIIGDVVVLSKDVEPSKYGLCYAVITEVKEGHFTVMVLAEDKTAVKGQCWPNRSHVSLETTLFRPGNEVEVVGPQGVRRLGKVVMGPDGVSFPAFRQHSRTEEVEFILYIQLHEDPGRPRLFRPSDLRQVREA